MQKKTGNEQLQALTLEQAVPIYTQQHVSNIHRFYLSTAIGDPSEYHQMCHVIRTAGPNDTVYIYINSPGGRLDATAQIISAMRESRAEIISVAEGVVASAATYIFLAADAYVVTPQCMMMLHNFSGGAYGKGHELESQIQADIKWAKTFNEAMYKGFLTPAELKKMLKGEDFWFVAEEVARRMEMRVEVLRAMKADEQRERLHEELEDHEAEIGKWLTSEKDKKALAKLTNKASAQIKSATRDALLGNQPLIMSEVPSDDEKSDQEEAAAE